MRITSGLLPTMHLAPCPYILPLICFENGWGIICSSENKAERRGNSIFFRRYLPPVSFINQLYSILWVILWRVFIWFGLWANGLRLNRVGVQVKLFTICLFWHDYKYFVFTFLPTLLENSIVKSFRRHGSFTKEFYQRRISQEEENKNYRLSRWRTMKEITMNHHIL